MVLRGTLTKNKKNSHMSLVYGGIAGCIARTMVAPMDKIKIVMQVENNNFGFRQTILNNIKNEGFLNLWKGNMINSVRIFPYSGLQFFTYDLCKDVFNNKKISNNEKLLYGATAGIVATTFTHPLDVIRHRLMCYNNIKSIRHAVLDIYKENYLRGFLKGYGSTVFSLTPFIALNFAVFDIMKENIDPSIIGNNVVYTLGLGSASALISQTLCYPLDTIRRRMQLKESANKNGYKVAKEIIKKEGIRNFYKGMLPNVLRIVPSNGIRFAIFDILKTFFNKY
jgi:solute carrier family 25 (mitochondrial phosphate transporter), member 23/24/25/41